MLYLRVCFENPSCFLIVNSFSFKIFVKRCALCKKLIDDNTLYQRVLDTYGSKKRMSIFQCVLNFVQKSSLENSCKESVSSRIQSVPVISAMYNRKV